jgi:vitamin B12 transporter
MNNIYPVTALALACAHALPVFAENTRLEEIIVTSSRIEMPLRQVGTSVSVITAQDIQERGFLNLADVLRYEPAISVTNTGGAGKATSLRIRGENGFRTKLLIDGIDVTDTSSPQAGPHFEQLSSAGTERIEILRGPQGLMYGADAGGVVAVTTRQAQPGLAGGASGEYGRYGTQQYAGNIGGGNETLDIALSGSNYETDGFNSRTTDTDIRDDDGYENTTVHGRAGWNISDTLRAELVGHQVDGDNDYDDCFTVDTFEPTNRCNDDFDQDAWRAVLTQQGDKFSNQLAYSENNIDRKFQAEGQRFYASKSELQRAEYLGSWSHSPQLALVYGLELKNESMDDGDFDTDRDQQGYYLEYQGNYLENIYLTAGARYDDNDDFGSKTTYRVSAAYLLGLAAGEIKFKGTYGTGFRAPSLYEIAYNGGPFAYPPASATELDKEESEGYDLGVGYYANSGWFAEATWFDQSVDDEIYFDLVDFSGYLQDNGESTSKGVELIGEIPLGHALALTGNYTYNDTEDAEGEDRLRAPKHMGNLGLSFRPWDGRLTLNLNVRLSHDVADEFEGDIDDYEVVDLNASYRILDSLEIYGRVENLTDEDYVEVPTYNTSGAAGYAGLRYTF